MVHSIKIQKTYFESVLNDTKTFELRKNDRGYEVGDNLILNEIDENNRYTGRNITVVVTYILNGPVYGLPSGYCIMAVKKCEKTESWESAFFNQTFGG